MNALVGVTFWFLAISGGFDSEASSRLVMVGPFVSSTKCNEIRNLIAGTFASVTECWQGTKSLF